MSRQPGLSEWTDLVSTHMPHLSVPQARVLALWSIITGEKVSQYHR